jgi:hypothetical protein
METKGFGGRFTPTERSLAEELMAEIASIAHEMRPQLGRHDDTVQLAARRELQIQRDSAARLRALFDDRGKAA